MVFNEHTKVLAGQTRAFDGVGGGLPKQAATLVTKVAVGPVLQENPEPGKGWGPPNHSHYWKVPECQPAAPVPTLNTHLPGLGNLPRRGLTVKRGAGHLRDILAF